MSMNGVANRSVLWFGAWVTYHLCTGVCALKLYLWLHADTIMTLTGMKCSGVGHEVWWYLPISQWGAVVQGGAGSKFALIRQLFPFNVWLGALFQQKLHFQKFSIQLAALHFQAAEKMMMLQRKFS